MSAIRPEIREQAEGIFDSFGFDQGLLFGAVCAALTVSADHIETLEARVATLADCLDCARTDWEANNGEIIDKTDPHWSVEARRLVLGEATR